VTVAGVRARAGAYWPRLRALLLALVLFFGLVAGAPFPTAEVRGKFPPDVLALLDSLQRVQLFLLAPVRGISDELGLSQRWALFVGAPVSRYRMHVEARAGAGEWQLLYRPHDPEHTFLARQLEYRRVRGAWNPRRTGTPVGYAAFVSWLAGRVFRERPEFSELRVRMERVQIEPRGAGYRATGQFVNEQRRLRAEAAR
jgi:hypothetical protein